MASTHGSEPNSSERNTSERVAVDAAADLELLERARSVVHADQILDVGPWWYAPLLSTFIAGVSIFGQDVTGPENLTSGLIAVMAGGFAAAHDHRRRGIRVRRSARGLPWVVASVLLFWFLAGAWGTAISTIGASEFLPGPAILAWTLTTLFLLGIGAALRAARNRRPVLR